MDATEVIGSSYHVSLGPKWGRAELITGQGTRIVHCNDLLFGALLSVHSCVSLNPNSIGENNGKSYGAATNWSLRFGNTCGCASKLNTFLVDPECTPAVTRLPGLHAVRQSYNPYSFEFQDCAPSTDPVMLADAALTRQLIQDNRVLSNRLWEHRGCSFTFRVLNIPVSAALHTRHMKAIPPAHPTATSNAMELTASQLVIFLNSD